MALLAPFTGQPVTDEMLGEMTAKLGALYREQLAGYIGAPPSTETISKMAVVTGTGVAPDSISVEPIDMAALDESVWSSPSQVTTQVRRNQDALPDAPSELIRVALDDLDWAEKHPDRFIIDMTGWHKWDVESQKCHVCMAGAVMARTLHIPDVQTFPVLLIADFGSDVRGKLVALDLFRSGYIHTALNRMGFSYGTIDKLKDLPKTISVDQTRPLRPQMEKIIKLLEAHNL